AFDLDRRVADDVEQRLVRPYVGFQRRDVEIADEDGGGVRRLGRHDQVHLPQEIELMPELRVDFRIGFVTSGRNVEIVNDDIAARDVHGGRDVPAIFHVAERSLLDQLERKAGDCGYPMVALLPIELDVPVTELAEGGGRK